jgi:hypothetical protein
MKSGIGKLIRNQSTFPLRRTSIASLTYPDNLFQFVKPRSTALGRICSIRKKSSEDWGTSGAHFKVLEAFGNCCGSVAPFDVATRFLSPKTRANSLECFDLLCFRTTSVVALSPVEGWCIWWRRRESNPRPKKQLRQHLRV